mgnify:CR=1 FL=1
MKLFAYFSPGSPSRSGTIKATGADSALETLPPGSRVCPIDSPDDAPDAAAGLAVAALLGLKFRGGKVETTVGHKNPAGLARTIIRLFEENGLTVRRSTINLKKKPR